MLISVQISNLLKKVLIVNVLKDSDSDFLAFYILCLLIFIFIQVSKFFPILIFFLCVVSCCCFFAL